MNDKSKKMLVYSGLNSAHGWITDMAQTYGFEVLLVEDSENVFERVTSDLPQFVLLDVSMPKKTGIECTREIKEFSSWVKVILISNVHSLSIQDSAKKARADLFVIDSVASVKVPEYIWATLQKKELPPDVSEKIEREVLSRRGAPRFPFEGEVQYQVGENWISGIFVNVSLDGLLFQTKDAVAIGQRLNLSWMDKGETHVEVFGIVVRQIPSGHPQYPYLIGVQFFATPPSLDKTITDFEEGENEEFKQGTELELDLELIRELISNGNEQFKKIFKGQKAPLFMELTIKDIVEHERASFQKTDDYSLCIRDLVSCKIICQLIESFTEKLKTVNSPISGYVGTLIDMTLEVLEKIDQTEALSDQLVKRSVQENKNTERHQLNESNNRLYQAKSVMLRAVSGKIKRNNVMEEYQERFDLIVQKNKQLTSYQEHLDEILKKENQELKARSTSRAPTRISRIVEKIQEITSSKNLDEEFATVSQSIKKIPALVFFAGMFALAVIYPFFENAMKMYFSKQDLVLFIKPKNIELVSIDSLKVDLQKEAWDQIGRKGRELVLDQIEVYLTHHKLRQCKIVDGDSLIAAVFRTVDDQPEAYLQHIFIESPLPVTANKKNMSKD